MKIAIELPDKPLPNKVFENSLKNLMLLNDCGHKAFLIKSSKLTNNYDGYVFLPYLWVHPVKVHAFKNSKPVICISNELFNRKVLGPEYVRVLINGNTPNFGQWNFVPGPARWKSLDIDPKFNIDQDCNTALITPASIHADINLGVSPEQWISSVLPIITKLEYNKIIIKLHPKVKDTSAQNKYVNTLLRETKKYNNNIEIISDNSLRNLASINYSICHNFSSTASLEAALAGKKIYSWSPRDWLYGYEASLLDRFKEISGCLWKPSEMDKMWENNKDLFESNIRVSFKGLDRFIKNL